MFRRARGVLYPARVFHEARASTSTTYQRWPVLTSYYDNKGQARVKLGLAERLVGFVVLAVVGFIGKTVVDTKDAVIRQGENLQAHSAILNEHGNRIYDLEHPDRLTRPR